MILVTAASGNIGRHVIRKLQHKQQPLRAGVYDEQDAPQILGEVRSAYLDFTDPATYPAALDSIKKIFLIRPPQLTDMETTLIPFVDYARRMGVTHIVFLSLLGVEDNPRVPHYAVEQHLMASKVPYTLLRPSFFMQNLNTVHRMEIKDKNEIYIPAGDAQTSFIDTRDIGAASARILTQNGHRGKTYDLTGPEALDYNRVAEIFSAVLQRKIVYRNPSLPAFVWRTWRGGAPLPFALVMASLYRETRAGKAALVTDDLPRLLDRPPITFREYVEDYQENWR